MLYTVSALNIDKNLLRSGLMTPTCVTFKHVNHCSGTSPDLCTEL